MSAVQEQILARFASVGVEESSFRRISLTWETGTLRTRRCRGSQSWETFSVSGGASTFIPGPWQMVWLKPQPTRTKLRMPWAARPEAGSSHRGRWQPTGLPLLAKLYVRAKDVAPLALWYDWTFRTKRELASELLKWAVFCLSWVDRPIWAVVDGGYAKRPFLDRARELSITVVGRLRKDAALCDVPPPRKAGQRGRPRKYGAKLSLAGRARHPRGWQTGEFLLSGQWVTKTYKTFLATSRFVPGPIRVVIVKEAHGWFAWFCTDPEASVADMPEAVADRAAIEQVFHDVKEVHGAGQQQLRNVWANIGAWNLLLWLFTLIELWAWRRDESELVDRTARPWDKAPRRPSHADKRNALRRACLQQTFSPRRATRGLTRKIQRLVNQLASLVC